MKVDTWTRLLYFARNKIPAAQLCTISGFNILAQFCGQMGHKTKGIGGIVSCSSSCDGEEKGKKITLSRNWKVIASELSHLRAMHISLHKNVILEEHSYQQTVLTWTICLHIEVGIADRQDPWGFAVHYILLYILFSVFLTVLWGKPVIMEIASGAKRDWEEQSSVTELRSHCTANMQCFSICMGTCMSPKTLIYVKRHHPNVFQVSSQTEKFERFWALHLIHILALSGTYHGLLLRET